jgi:hypothetical protein
MQGFVLLFLSLFVDIHPVELPRDLHEIQTQRFAMPIGVANNLHDTIEQIRLFVSEDQGKTWRHKKDYKPSDKQVLFTAPRDGIYWFALQVVLKDGSQIPDDLDDLVATKVCVNSERRSLKTQKSYEELQREVEQLRRTVEELQKKIKQLELDHKSK